MTVQGNDIDSDLNFSVDLDTPDPEALREGFNRHGVKETEDRVEFVFEAMQPGVRNGVRITEEFLEKVADNHDGEAPLQLNHDRSMESNVGRVEEVWFSDGALRLRGYVPKTGADTHEEFVKRFTFDPPQVQNGSVGFGMQYEMTEDDDGNPALADGTMQEFSLTPFPGGYDEDTGGLKAQFEQAYQQYKADTGDDEASQDSVSGAESADYSLVTETLHNYNDMTFERIEFDELPEDLPEEVTQFVSDAREQHNQNIEFIESVIEAREEAEDEAEDYQEELEGFKAEFAEDIAERDGVPLSADELKDFSLSRLHEMDAETAEADTEEEDFEEDEDENEDEETDFGRKERKSGNFTEDRVRSEAADGLDTIPGIVTE